MLYILNNREIIVALGKESQPLTYQNKKIGTTRSGYVGRCLEMIERRLQNRTIKNEHNNQRTEIRLRRVVVQDQDTVPSSEMFPARFHLCHIQPNDAE